MRIQTNIESLNAYRNLNNTNRSMRQSMEKLSSGFRINRAADDAAGLAISEKMRGQVRGLNQAVRNAQDSNSMIQTAEGALNESHEILQRMRELAVQSANDTNTYEDRTEIQAEVDQLAAELTRIAGTTEFNTQNLLDGTLDNNIFHIGANEDQSISLSIDNMDANALDVAGADGATLELKGGWSITTKPVDLEHFEAGESYTFDVVELDSIDIDGEIVANYGLANKDGEIVAASEEGKEFHFLDDEYSVEDLSAQASFHFLEGGIGFGYDKVTFNDPVTDGLVSFDIPSDGSIIDNVRGTINPEIEGLEPGTYTINTETSDIINLLDDTNYSIEFGDGSDYHHDRVRGVLTNNFGEAVAVAFEVDAAGDNIGPGNHYIWYQIDDVNFSVEDSDALTDIVGDAEAVFTQNTKISDLILLEVSGSGIDVSTQDAADGAITIINEAIVTVSSQRSELGAVQNRLDHTIANLEVASENLQAAESRIRDVDMAKEMTGFSMQQILEQAGIAMLAQSNQAPQSVLQLLG